MTDVESINLENVENNYVKKSIKCTGMCQLIIDEDEIVLLKMGFRTLINKYEEKELTTHNKTNSSVALFNEYCKLFELNKIYLNFGENFVNSIAHKYYCTIKNDKVLWLDEKLSVNNNEMNVTSYEVNREELQQFFNHNNYDSMYVIDLEERKVLFANNKKDGKVLGSVIVPSNEEIIKLELKSRLKEYNRLCIIGKLKKSNDEYEKINKIKNINSIKNFPIYKSGLSNHYRYLMVTTKDGNFNLEFFELIFVKDNKFKLTINPLPVLIPSIDNKYSSAKQKIIKK